jgi:hypothetical protein
METRCLRGLQTEAHDDGVFPAVPIISRADAARLKVKTAVERNGPVVGATDFQENFLASLRLREIHDILQKQGAHSAASPFRVNREIEDMGLICHQPEAKIAPDLMGERRFCRRQQMRMGKEELLFKQVPRPRSGKGQSFYGQDFVQILLEQAADFELAG